MSATHILQRDEVIQPTLDLLNKIFNNSTSDNVGFRLWDGTQWPDDKSRSATILLKHPGTLREMFLSGTEVGLAEAYLYDDFDIDGDIEAVFEMAETLSETTTSSKLWKLDIYRDLLALPDGQKRQSIRRGRSKLIGKRHSIKRDRQAIAYHYDVSNNFYALWLDRHMVYSCAFFTAPDIELDMAQEYKLDYICRKLRLQCGQRLLDLGCGWGGLVLHAAQHYGVDAVGITLSQPQADKANELIAKAGLTDQCQVYIKDYREVDEPEGYDYLVSVGMFEHVGAELLPTYFAKAWQQLKPGGVFLNHGIAQCAIDTRSPGPTFSNTYVFPDSELVPINVSLHAAEEAGFEVRDVESLREHYIITLRHWVRRLEQHHEQSLQFVDELTYRVWRLFMSGSAHGFSSGSLNVYQTLLLKPNEGGHSGLPLTREDWYTEGERKYQDCIFGEGVSSPA